MKIAIISDIHGNMVALNSALEDIKRRGIDKIYCLGDMVIKCSSPSECVDKVLSTCAVIIMGNCEERVTNTPRIEEHYWNKDKLSVSQIERIKSLPLYYDLYISGLRIRLMHASPNTIFEKSKYWDFDAGFESRMEDMFKNTTYLNNLDAETPDVVIFGHIHRPMIIRFKDKMILNPGAISNSSDIVTKNGKSYSFGSYLVIDGELDSKELSKISYNIVRFKYDNLKEAENIRNTDMPNKEEAAHEIETGEYFNRFSIYHKE